MSAGGPTLFPTPPERVYIFRGGGGEHDYFHLTCPFIVA